MDEITRVVKYIGSCREAGIDCTVTIDKSKTHLILNVLQKQIPKRFIYPSDDQEPYRCPACNDDLGFTDDYFGDLEITHYCKNCGQKLCK